jgi:hypothetical protein
VNRVALPLVAAVLVAAATGAAVPWPGGRAPESSETRARIALADERAARNRFDDLTMAIDDQKAGEISGFLQSFIDDGEFGKIAVRNYGQELFRLEFEPALGYGSAALGRVGPRRVHDGDRGGLDSYSCAGCHSQGGTDGAGASTQSALVHGDGRASSSADVRNPPALPGAGLVQALGVEMTDDLRYARERGLAAARDAGEPVSVVLSSKGVSFGTLIARPDGTVDAAGITGVDPDLVVRPFGWKGDVGRLRDFVTEAARVHFGIQVSDVDADGDGHFGELREGAVTSEAVYLEMLEAPVVLPPDGQDLLGRWADGDRAFDALGCAGCHVRTLKLDDRFWVEKPEGTASPGIRVNLLADGDTPKGSDAIGLFSDLRRHAMGAALADRNDTGVARDQFQTRALWGLAETGPWLHDGRATTLDAAILAHGGEAQAARDAYAALPDADRADLRVFLVSLTRQPGLRLAE